MQNSATILGIIEMRLKGISCDDCCIATVLVTAQYADTCLNRLLHNSYRLEMNGKNMRDLTPLNK